jgi:hypothetical protein
LLQLLRQRVYQVAGGYEDRNDGDLVKWTRHSDWLDVRPVTGCGGPR